MLLILEQNLSFNKVHNLNTQKEIISTLTKLQKDDIELALIQFNGKSTQLLHEIDKLRSLYQFDISGQYLLNNSQEYLSELDKLSKLTIKFNIVANDYYENDTKKEELNNEFYRINNHINNLIFKDILYNEAKFGLLQNIMVFTFIIVFIGSIWYRKQLSRIHKDLLYLYAIDKVKKEHEIFSEEVDAILLRMTRKNTNSTSTDMIDPVTQINNNKGMLHSYAEKKGMKDSNFTSVTILEIDNFSKSNRSFSQDIVQAILKKTAFTLSLHEQVTDVIARTDYNQFTIILSRSSKEQLFKDMDIIRQTIAEIKLKSQDKGVISVTVSGGFVIKENNKHLEESLKEAKKTLQYAKTLGVNTISQASDLLK